MKPFPIRRDVSFNSPKKQILIDDSQGSTQKNNMIDFGEPMERHDIEYRQELQNNDAMVTSTFYSLTAGEEAVRYILKQTMHQITDLYHNSLIPYLSIERVFQLSELILDDVVGDENMTEFVNQGLIDELEPRSLHHEHWSSFKVNFEKKVLKPIVDDSDAGSVMRSKYKSRLHSSTSTVVVSSVMKIKKSKPESVAKSRESIEDSRESSSSQRKIKNEDVVQINLGQPVEEDVLENGMRLAYERELQLKAMQEKAERQRQEEMREHLKQLKSIQGNFVANKKTITYDFQGKLIVQSPPDFERMPPTATGAYFETHFIAKNDKRDNQSNQGVKQEIIRKQKHKETNINIDNQRNTDGGNIIEHITLEKGVKIISEHANRDGPKGENQFHLMNQQDLKDTLLNPNLELRLSRKEYHKLIQNGASSTPGQTIVQRQTAPSNLNQNKVEKINFNLSDTINSSINLKPNQINAIQRGNMSVNSSLVNQTRGGSIKILNESQSHVEDLLIEPNLESQQSIARVQNITAGLPQLPQKDLITPVSKFTLDILQSQDWGKQDKIQYLKKLQLPKRMVSTHSLPQLPKNPRERLKSLAQQSFVQSKKLPPPIVGNVVGHHRQSINLVGL